jgi:hypothetical protein
MTRGLKTADDLTEEGTFSRNRVWFRHTRRMDSNLDFNVRYIISFEG